MTCLGSAASHFTEKVMLMIKICLGFSLVSGICAWILSILMLLRILQKGDFFNVALLAVVGLIAGVIAYFKGEKNRLNLLAIGLNAFLIIGVGLVFLALASAVSEIRG